MLTYPLFIDEVRALRADIDNLRTEPNMARSVAFKKWNHALCMLVSSIRKNGYRSTGCYVESRDFELDNAYIRHDPTKLFNDELDNTMIELDNVISNYEKYGDPKPPAALEPSAPTAVPAVFTTLPKPGELTWAWVRINVPFSYWGLVAGLIITVAGLAFGAGRLYEGFASKVDSPVAYGSSTKLQPAAAAAAPAPIQNKTSTIHP